MAKQNVTFVERHAEKFVIGVCGAILLGISVFYLAGSPHKVEVAGQPLPPKVFYDRLRQEADQAAMRSRNARPSEPSPGTAQRIELEGTDSPLESRGLPREIAVAFVPPQPDIPEITAAGLGAVRLAEVLPPTRPVLTAGRSPGTLPTPSFMQVGAQQSGEPIVGHPRDYHWVTILGTVQREKQRTEYESENYLQERLSAIVIDFEVERQERLPSGEWGPGEIILPYRPAHLQVVPAVDVYPLEDQGAYGLSPEAIAYIEALRQEVAGFDRQSRILRPDFQRYLDKPHEWKVPRKLEGVELVEFGAIIYEEGLVASPVRPVQPTQPPPRTMDQRAGGPGRGGYDMERGGGGRATPPPRPQPAAPAAAPVDGAAIRQAREMVSKAEQALKDEKWLVARELLEDLSRNSFLPQNDQKKVEDLLEQHREDFRVADLDLLEQQQLRDAKAALGFGPDMDPFWVNDISVVPGRTYRYRVRLWTLNQYAGMPSHLQDPMDAGKIIVVGEWSDWSDPQLVPPNRQLFFATIRDNRAKLDYLEWMGGKWEMSSGEFAVGEPVKFLLRGRMESQYGAILASLEPEAETLVLVRENGELEERDIPSDRIRRRDFQNERKKEEDRERALSEVRPMYQPAAPQQFPGQMDRMRGPMRGGDFGRGS